jgi:hypothetical protein
MKVEKAICLGKTSKWFSVDELLLVDEKVKNIEAERIKKEEAKREEEIRKARFLYD